VSRVGGSAQVKAMRTVAGRLRLDLAQYRELEAFSAFASDLDKATKAQLDRGARVVEVLKQPQYKPMPVEQQVMIIYAVTNGYLDDVEVERIGEWERGFHEFMHAQYPQVGDRLRNEKVLSNETEEDLKRGITAFKAAAGKADASKAQTAKADAPKGGAPKADAPKAATPKAEPPKPTPAAAPSAPAQTH